MTNKPEAPPTAAGPPTTAAGVAGLPNSAPPQVPALSTLSLKDAFDMYQKQADSVHKIWAYFQAVSIAVVAYALSGQLPEAAGVTRIAFAFAYAVFAISNAVVIFRTQKEMYEFAPVVRAIAAGMKDVGNKLLVDTTKPSRVVAFHLFTSAAVVTAILFLGSPTTKPSAQNIISAAQVVDSDAHSISGGK